MVIAHHLMWTAYGYWLPNDPRGSMSHEIRNERIQQLGAAHYGRKPIQPSSAELREFRAYTQSILKHQLLALGDKDVQVLACGFADVIKTRNYTYYACAIMPDHVHLLIRKHRDRGETMIEQFQKATRDALIDADAHRRSVDHPVWGGPGWNVFHRTPQQVETTIEYIRKNPVKIGRPVQHWTFVTDYDGGIPGLR